MLSAHEHNLETTSLLRGNAIISNIHVVAWDFQDNIMRVIGILAKDEQENGFKQVNWLIWWKTFSLSKQTSQTDIILQFKFVHW